MKIIDIEMDGIDYGDYPKFCDAFIVKASYTNGKELSEDELEALNEDAEFVYDQVTKVIY